MEKCFYYDDGSYYDGEVDEDDLPCGFGIMNYADGSYFRGIFLDGYMKGRGTLYDSHGDIEASGIFRGKEFLGEWYDEDEDYARIFKFKLPSGNVYEGTIDDVADRDGYGTLTFTNGDKYTGFFWCDDFHGEGQYIMASGGFYVGHFRSGSFEGKGTYHYSDGSKYSGDFVKDKFCGRGEMYDADGNITESGIYKDDKYWGPLPEDMKSSLVINQIHYPDGSVFQGETYNKLPHGKGRIWHKNRFLWYEGEFLFGKRHGQGKSYYNNGSPAYNGYWVNDNEAESGISYYKGSKVQTFANSKFGRSWSRRFYDDGTKIVGEGNHTQLFGDGYKFNKYGFVTNCGEYRYDIPIDEKHKVERVEFSDGAFYEGRLDDDRKRHGYGWYHFPNGDDYLGEFCNGDRTGKGVYYFNSGSVYNGILVKGNFNGKGVIRYSDGEVYDGDFKDDNKHGRGIYRYKDGKCKYGIWKDNSYFGTDPRMTPDDFPVKSLVYKDGSKYKGHTFDVLPHGTGVMRHADGSVYDGEFLFGKRHGYGKFFGTNGVLFYEGQHVDGERSGKGIMYMNGYVEEGLFINGFLSEGKTTYDNGAKEWGHYIGVYRYGQGVDIDEDGKESSGYIEEDEYVDVYEKDYDVMRFEDGSYYAGEVDYIGYCYLYEQHGRGFRVWEDGESFAGIWRQRKMFSGIYHFADGRRYFGDFDYDGSPLPPYKVFYPNGDRFEMSLERDGVMYRKDGTSVKMSEDQINLKFRDTSDDGEYIDKEVYEYNVLKIDDMLNGEHRIDYEDGDSYEGSFVYGWWHGKGALYHEDGRVDVGIFALGEYIGPDPENPASGKLTKGKLKYKDGTMYEGYILNGNTAHLMGKFTFPSGNVYEGDINLGKLHGRGKMTYTAGDLYEGEFRNGKKEGYGIYNFASGASYQGEWKDGKRHGIGAYIDKNGKIIRGQYADDKFVG